MKKYIHYTLIVVFVALVVQVELFSQPIPVIQNGYYIVVGSFRYETNALAYTKTLIAKEIPAIAEKDSVTGLNYVHLGREYNKEEAIARVVSLRHSSRFKDAWVKTIPIQPLVLADAADTSHALAAIANATQTDDERPPGPVTEFEISNTEVFLHLFNAANDKMVDGTVEVIDTERSRLIEKATGNSYYVLADPKSKSKRITLIGDVFGYRKVQNEISYPLSSADSLNPNIEIVGTIVMIRFDMVRYIKGDVNILYNVYFYNDASIMQQESKYELNKLLEMMQENPRYRIKLHGHSNGNSTGKILEPGSGKDLFDLTGAIEAFGSAKELSFKRATVIKEYLVNNGIREDRIEIKSWGGKKPLYDKNSVNAKRNVRVEVEILEE